MAYGEGVTTMMRWRGRGEGTTKTTAGGWRYAGDAAGEGREGGGGGGLQATPPLTRWQRQGTSPAISEAALAVRMRNILNNQMRWMLGERGEDEG
jgi:hypothetical protein